MLRVRRWRWMLRAASLLGLLIPLAALGAVHQAGDTWWPATVVLFAPRWIFGLPALAMLAMALLTDWSSCVICTTALVITAVPLGGWQWSAPAEPSPQSLRIITYNTGGEFKASREVHDWPELLHRIVSWDADVVALQECDDLAPLLHDIPNYHVVHGMAKLCMLTKFPVVSAETIDATQEWKDNGAMLVSRVVLQAPWGRFQVVPAHLATQREGLQLLLYRHPRAIPVMNEKMQERWHESRKAMRYASAFAGPTIVLGDFNTPPDSLIIREVWLPHYTDAFAAAGRGYGWTKFTRWSGFRIDMVLTSPAWIVRDAEVLPIRWGDHQPLQVTLDLKR